MKRLLSCLQWLDRNIERLIIIISYSAMAGIIFVEVIRRFFFGLQAPWSVQVPIFLYLILAWVGAAYNAKTRSHLSFNALRMIMGRRVKYCCTVFDYLAWVLLSCVVIYVTIEQVQINRDNFSMILGTEIMTWYFLTATPVGWALILYRVTQNFIKDTKEFILSSGNAKSAGGVA